MGYYTRYDLNYVHSDGTAIWDSDEKENLDKAILESLSTINPSYFNLNYFNLGNDLYSFFKDEIKWYEHNEDMIKLSANFPNLTFILEGEGEDKEDVWIAYYHNGESEECYAHLVYDKPTKDFALKIET